MNRDSKYGSCDICPFAAAATAVVGKYVLIYGFCHLGMCRHRNPIRWADVVEREGHPFHSMDEQYVALRKSNHKDPFGFVTLGPVVSSI